MQYPELQLTLRTDFKKTHKTWSKPAYDLFSEIQITHPIDEHKPL